MKTATMKPPSFIVIVLLLCSGSGQIAEESPCPAGCKKCPYASNRQAVCDEDSGCNTGYIFVNGICFRCPMYCDKCSLDSDTASVLCLEHGCHEGYWLNDVTSTGVCEACPLHCHKCEFNWELRAVVCSKNGCYDGYRLDTVWGLCERNSCQKGCKQCVYDSAGQLICDEDTGCEAGYIFINGRCLSIEQENNGKERTKEQEELSLRCAICWLWKYRHWIMGGAGLAAAPVAIPAAVVSLGFGSGGVVAGSIAAKLMALFATATGGGVAAGGFIAWLQSVGAAGLGAVGSAFAYLTGGLVGTIFSSFDFLNMDETCKSCYDYVTTCD